MRYINEPVEAELDERGKLKALVWTAGRRGHTTSKRWTVAKVLDTWMVETKWWIMPGGEERRRYARIRTKEGPVVEVCMNLHTRAVTLVGIVD